MKRFIFIISAIVFCCMAVSATQLTSAQKKAKKEIFDAAKKIGTNVSDAEDEYFLFKVDGITYSVSISSTNYNPLYLCLMASFDISNKGYNPDIVRIAVNNAALNMPVCAQGDENSFAFSCEMYAKDASPFIAVLPNMIKAIQTSVKNFEDAYSEAEKNYSNESSSYATKYNKDDNVYIFPLIASSSDNDFYITKVTLTSTYTILDVTAYNGGHYQWATISKDSYLFANGKKYTLKKAEGIAYSPQHTDFPGYESGRNVSLSFKLYFPALPQGTTKFDFSEGTEGWQIKGVELKHGNLYEINGEQTETSFHKWNCTAIEVQDNQTIVYKIGTPKTSGTTMFSQQDEYIEDADTGRKYYLINSSLGFEGSPTRSYDTETVTFYEVYPSLPSNVKRINISSGNHYYIKGLRIR